MSTTDAQLRRGRGERRSNWSEYVLYGVVSGSVRELWGLAHRNDDCVEWHVRSGQLHSFTVRDRWKGLPPALQMTSDRVPYREYRALYVFDPATQRWRERDGRWAPYRPEASLSPNALQALRQCKLPSERLPPDAD